MSQIPLSQTISDLKEISKQVLVLNAEIAERLNQEIAELEKLEAISRTDQVIGRLTKISEILAIVAKILFDFFSST